MNCIWKIEIVFQLIKCHDLFLLLQNLGVRDGLCLVSLVSSILMLVFMFVYFTKMFVSWCCLDLRWK